MPKLSKEIEEELIKIVTPILEKGRPNWDLPHTLLVVKFIKKLINAEGGNERILIPAAYLHDIGYSGLFNGEFSLENIKKVGKLHMEIGSRKSKEILNELNFSKEEIKEICHLVSVHDNVEILNSDDEIMIMEADCLSQLDRKNIEATLNKKEYQEFLHYFESERIPLFKHPSAKEFLKELWPIAKAELNKLN